ncbi:MAG: 4-hydroxy-tetrahydrodipicolinate reductase [Deltaproteobacteria bacterium]
MARKIKVAVAGALGKMGLETLKAVMKDSELELVGAIDARARGEAVSALTGETDCGIMLGNDLEAVIKDNYPDVLIDFTNPQSVFNNTKTALKNGVYCVVGTTGLNEVELKQLEKLALEKEIGVAVIPNFAIGAVLMMKFAREAARYFPDVEIIELHHDQKMDAPSGTAIKTAEMIAENRASRPPKNIKEFEKVAGARGGEIEQVRIHSIRLPGFIAHQEVIFGAPGQSLKIRHDSMDRAAFMPGVVMVAKAVMERQGLIYGMENLI